MSKMILQWVILCKIDTFCYETGERICEGDKMLYIPGSKIINLNAILKIAKHTPPFACENTAITGFKC